MHNRYMVADWQSLTEDEQKQHLSIVAEIRELEELLAAIPEANVIERMSLEARLQTAKDLLATLPQTRETPKAK